MVFQLGFVVGEFAHSEKAGERHLKGGINP
jgi:hypothetical protein